MYKKTLSWVLAFIMIFTILGGFSPENVEALDTNIIDDDFESATVGDLPDGWIIKYNGDGDSLQEVVTGISVSGDNSFKLDGASSWSATIYKNLPTELPDSLVLEAYVRPASTGESGSISLFNKSGDTWGAYLARLIFGNGKIYYSTSGHDENNLVELQDYSIDTWYHVKLVHDLVERKFDIYIGGVKKAENVAFYSNYAVDSLVLSSGNASGTNLIYYDDIKLYYELPDIWGIEIESTDMYPFGGGNGSSEVEAYEISTANQLSQLAYNVNKGNSYSGKYFKLTGDIDLSGKEWVPIGDGYNTRFLGSFNGNGYKIEELTITETNGKYYYGLFGYLGNGGIIDDINIDSGIISLGASLDHNPSIGGIVGYNNGLVKGCTNKSDIISEYDSWTYAGGIVGMGNSDINSYSWSGGIQDCRNEGNISIGDVGSAGGIVGVQLNSNTYTHFFNLSNTGNITGGRNAEIGGIAGRFNGTGLTTNPMINCFNTGDLRTGSTEPDAYVSGDIGGIVGYLYSGIIENCFNSGDIEVVYLDTTNTAPFDIGGIVGYGGPPRIYNSYNIGNITGPEDRVGPMSGANGYYFAHKNCYYLEGSVPNSLINTGATKLTEDQMKGSDASTILFINSSDEEVTYGPANGAFIYALNNGKGEEAYSWYYEDRYNDGFPVLYYNNETPYVISFDSRGGTTVSAVTIISGDSINTSPVTSKEGDTFKGWFTEVEGGKKIEFPFKPDGSIILYGLWESDIQIPSKPSVPRLEIETEVLKDGVENEEYELQVEGDGGKLPYIWSAEGLPKGLSISEEGMISGTPEEVGDFSVKIELIDSRNYYRSGIFSLKITKDESESEDTKEEDSMEDPFSDIDEHWAKDYINGTTEKNIINGYPDGTFRPNNNVTREEFASLLVRVLDLENNSEMVFSDTLDRWSTEDISTAAYYEIIKGYDENKFGPEDFITREQMAVMIARALDLEEGSGDGGLNDIQNASSWARDSIVAVVNEGLIEGYPDGIFKPMNNLTRAEAVKVIYSIMK